ncbi:blood group Rh(D) polypeptide-like [Melanerpes formicivorus]|uniref:blood group Rh(D) polypeptide-like n=1 Tax=Melanerpes formicivorus TaxID=211600 RepID=UPI00358EB6C4
MPAHYRSFRGSLPWLILLLQALLLLLFYFFVPEGAGPALSPGSAAFQDVSHMLLFGFGFSFLFLRRFGFSSIGLNLLLLVLGVQSSVLAEQALPVPLQRQRLDGLQRITKAVVSMTAVVISTGAVLGKANPVQLILMTVVEVLAFHGSRWLTQVFLQLPDSIPMRHVHLFGACFGLALSSRFSEPAPSSEKSRRTPRAELLSMLGTLFLWLFWPSFNLLLDEEGRSRTISNTYFALAASTVAAFVLSALTTKDGKFQMSHIQSAVLAGGVAVGSAAPRIESPWIAMILGLLASLLTSLGAYCLQRCLNPALKIHDTSGVHFTFGWPAVLGGLAQVVLLVVQNWDNLPSLGALVMIHVGAFCLTISVASIIGFITGSILNLRVFRTTPVSKYFEDQCYWEFPHLAVGF